MPILWSALGRTLRGQVTFEEIRPWDRNLVLVPNQKNVRKIKNRSICWVNLIFSIYRVFFFKLLLKLTVELSFFHRFWISLALFLQNYWRNTMNHVMFALKVCWLCYMLENNRLENWLLWILTNFENFFTIASFRL